jgi:hypothetical protein
LRRRKFCSRTIDRRGRIADQHRAAVAALDQRDPAQDQRARDALAEIGLGDQQRAQVRRIDQQHLDVGLGRPSTSDGRPDSWPTSARNWPAP